MNLSRTRRLLKLITLLQTARGYNVESLALACEVSRRTIFRDLDILRESGLPLQFDERAQGFRISGSVYLPPMDFTAEEALALTVLCHELGNATGLPFLGPASTAAVKLEGILPVRLRKQLQNMAQAVEIHAPPTNPLDGHAETYRQLLAAIAEHRCVRLNYQSLAERQDIGTRLCPYRLLFSRRSWYVIGRSSLHRSARTFNLARILNLEVLDDTYQIPRGFSIERYLGNAWHLIPEPGPDREILVRFSPMVAQNVAEVVWHKTQRVTFNEDGSLDFRATVSGLSEISWWIQGYADQAEVLEPPELRQIIARRATATAARYAGDTAREPSAIPAPHAWALPSPRPSGRIQ